MFSPAGGTAMPEKAFRRKRPPLAAPSGAGPGPRRGAWWGRTLRDRREWAAALSPIPGLFGWYKNNVAAGTLFVALFLVLKGYVLARADIATALGILQYAGLTSVVIAGLLSALPILAAAMLAFTVYRVVSPPRSSAPLLIVMAGAAVVSAFFTQWTFTLAAVVIGALISALRQFTRGQLARRKVRGARLALALVLRGLAAILLVGGSVYAVIAMLYTVWLPHEIVAFSPARGNPSSPQVGYVLSESDGWITILTSGAHQIVRFHDAGVTSATICERGPGRRWYDGISTAPPAWREIAAFVPPVRPAVNKTCPGS